MGLLGYLVIFRVVICCLVQGKYIGCYSNRHKCTIAILSTFKFRVHTFVSGSARIFLLQCQISALFYLLSFQRDQLLQRDGTPAVDFIMALTIDRARTTQVHGKPRALWAVGPSGYYD